MLVRHERGRKRAGLLIFTSRPKGLHSVTTRPPINASSWSRGPVPDQAEELFINSEAFCCTEAPPEFLVGDCVAPAIMAAPRPAAHNVSRHVRLAEDTLLVFQH